MRPSTGSCVFQGVLLFTAFAVIWTAEDSYSIGQGFDLNVTNSGPVIAGSFIKFNALLFLTSSAKLQDKDHFIYEWQDMFHELTRQRANFNTTLEKCLFLDAGEYLMKVGVFDIKSFTLVANKSSTFHTTDTLNGYLGSHQEPGYHRPGSHGVYSTADPVHLTANLTDVFTNLPVYSYNWSITGPINNTVPTQANHWSTDLKHPGFYNIGVSVLAINVAYCDERSATHTVTGVFNTSIELKDPVIDAKVTGNHIIQTNESLTLYVLYKGSPPFNVCWSLEPVSGPGVNQSNCTANITGHRHRLPVTTPPAGKYKFHINITNDVSRTAFTENVDVREPKVPHYHSFLVVVGPVVLGLLSVTIGLIVVVQLIEGRQNKHTPETADFSFHPTLEKSLRPEDNRSFFHRFFGRVFKGKNSEATNVLIDARRPSYGTLSSSM